jgi:hypothetical protein
MIIPTPYIEILLENWKESSYEPTYQDLCIVNQEFQQLQHLVAQCRIVTNDE